MNDANYESFLISQWDFAETQLIMQKAIQEAKEQGIEICKENQHLIMHLFELWSKDNGH